MLEGGRTGLLADGPEVCKERKPEPRRTPTCCEVRGRWGGYAALSLGRMLPKPARIRRTMKRRLVIFLVAALVSVFGAAACGGGEEGGGEGGGQQQEEEE